MAASLDDDEFHPETPEPIKSLWRKLLSARPLPGRGIPLLTKAQQRARAIKVQEYYATHKHPRGGLPVRKPE